MVSRCSRGSNLINSSFNINYYTCTSSVFSYTLQYSQYISRTIYQRSQIILWLCAFEFVWLASLDTRVNTIKSQPSKLANSVLHFIFNGYTGFTFPAAHCPVKVMSAEELNHLTHRLNTQSGETWLQCKWDSTTVKCFMIEQNMQYKPDPYGARFILVPNSDLQDYDKYSELRSSHECHWSSWV